jgi:hypothetical protein
MEQTDGFQSFRTRSFLERMGNYPWCLNRNVFMVLGLLKFTFKGFRSKAFSSVYLFRFSELQLLFPIAT